ncbi:hypothetical protein BMS3Abin04_01565 [bacterium BMS3Abin04]|nr:hypothetical protein BMS3Abin04_01565 [bacterium BMS3Abin04]
MKLNTMKVFLIFSLMITFLFSASPIDAQKTFEGKIKFKVTNNGEDMSMNYYMKNGEIRIDMPGGMGGAMIYKGKKMIIINPQQKMYMEFSVDKMKKMAKKFKSDDSDGDADNAKDFDPAKWKTGETKTLFGHECELYRFTEDGQTTEMWVAKDMGNFMGAQNPMAPSSSPLWQQQLAGTNFFPLQVIVKDKDGKVNSKFEVVELKEQSLSDDLFNVPSGYNKVSIPGMN